MLSSVTSSTECMASCRSSVLSSGQRASISDGQSTSSFSSLCTRLREWIRRTCWMDSSLEAR